MSTLPRGPFLTTSWTLIAKARSDSDARWRLLERYWKPAYSHLLSRGMKQEQAADVTQGFLLHLFESGHLVDRADPERSRFRTYFRSALNNFVIDKDRKVHGRGHTRTFVPYDEKALEDARPGQDVDPWTVLDSQWATVTFDEAVNRVERDCRQRGMERHWAIFEARWLNPTKYGTDKVPVTTLMGQYDVSDPQQISAMVDTLKRKLERALHEVVGETVENPQDLAEELQTLWAILADCLAR